MKNNSKKKYPVWIIVSTLVFIAITPGIVLAKGISISSSVNKNHLTLEDSIELSVTVYGLRSPSKPELPPLSDFQVRSTGTQSSTQIFNSDVQTSITHKYLLIPKNFGKFVIGPAILNISGSVYKSNPITVTVEKSKPTMADRNKNIFTCNFNNFYKIISTI